MATDRMGKRTLWAGMEQRDNQLESIKNRLNRWIKGLAEDSQLQSDPEQLRLRKAVLILLAIICTVLGIFWGLTYFFLGRHLAGSFPLGYAALSAASLVYYHVSKRYKFFCRSQLFLILILPVLLQWSLGGFSASGSVMIWSILAPIGALMFAGTRRAIPWFFAYLILMILSGLLDGRKISQPVLPQVTIIISFVMNIGAVSAIVFFLLKFFVHSREQAMAALDRENRKVRHSLSLAMEVQQNLLPGKNPSISGLDIAGRSVYCDETGGDYYDFINSGSPQTGSVNIVVGDVSDHGISSALLMATARAFIRQRSSQPGTVADIVNDTNRQLVEDVEESGRFMTLFFTEIDRPRLQIRWLNAGHEPAIIYDPEADSFKELPGDGSLPLGISVDTRYREAHTAIATGQIIVIATDGIREAGNRYGDLFGKKAFYRVIRDNAAADAEEIVRAIFTAVDLFQYGHKVEDDMTLVVVKVTTIS